MIDDINKKFIEQLNKYIELILEHIKSLEHTSNLMKNLQNTFRIDLNQRYKIRNNYYHKKFPLLLHDLSVIKTNKICFQLVEQQHNQSIKFYKNVFNIQSSINIEQYDKQFQQSIETFNNLKTNINQCETNIEQLKQELIKQNQQINIYVNNLFNIQYEQYQIEINIKQLKQKILFEKNLYYEIKQIYSEEKNSFFDSKITFEIHSKKLFHEKQQEYIDQLKQKQQILKNEEITLKNNLKNSKDFNQNQLHQFHTEYINLMNDITQMKLNIQQKKTDLLPLQNELSFYRKIINKNRSNFTQSKNQPLRVLPTTTTMNTEEIKHESTPLINKLNKTILHSEQQQLPIESTIESESTKFKSEKIMPATAKLHRSESLGPNLQSRLEALEVAMGVRLNVAKRQGRHSLSNTTSSSPMQLSPTSSSTTTTTVATINTSISNSLSTSTRHNIPIRTGQGVQRSASSCDAENRPGPIKRLKPSLPNENSSSSSSSTVAAIATIKKYPPSVRRPLPTSNVTPTRPTQSKQSTPIKQRSSPMDTSSPRLSRSSTASNNSSSNSSNYRTPIGSISPKTSHTPSPKSQIINSLPNLTTTISHKKSLLIFGERFSDDIIKINLLWIDLKELDNESRSEVNLQFGSIENFLREQSLFFKKQQQRLKLASKNKTNVNRSRFHLSITKKDRLELL
ncbi:unnamed protein product [Rotaria sp. Silwood2]|nr:unnamed protein product [Rotaria sp. Silwood2]CAF3013739.1 unnamed protein product [Rotaria sp. Silwood2]